MPRGEGTGYYASNNLRRTVFHRFTGGLTKVLSSVFGNSVSGVLAAVLTGGDYVVVCMCLQDAHERVEL
jgi:hypothetical protein